MKITRTALILTLALGVILALSSVAFAQTTDKVTVKDQAIVNGTVTIAQVDAAQDGWLVVHAQANGNPGPDLGHAAVKAGVNKDVVVKIDESKATPVLYAMLHVDLGQKGVYEFPGADVPAQGAQTDVNPTFNVTTQAASQGASNATSSSATTSTSTGGASPKTLPTTGGDGNGTLLALLSAGMLLVAVGYGLSRRRESK